MSDGEESVARIDEIRRTRSLRAANGALVAIVVSQLLFASFAVGHALGPTPLRRLELAAGIALSFLAGVALALPVVRRRLEAGARLRADLSEGRHRRRVLLFDDHMVLDQEVVMLADVESAARDGRKLLLRYADPAHGGRMLRELSGDVQEVDDLVRSLTPSAPQGI